MSKKPSHKAIEFQEMFCNDAKPQKRKLKSKALSESILKGYVNKSIIEQELDEEFYRIIENILKLMYNYTIRTRKNIRKSGEFSITDYSVYANVMRAYSFSIDSVVSDQPISTEIQETIAHYKNWRDLPDLLNDILATFEQEPY